MGDTIQKFDEFADAQSCSDKTESVLPEQDGMTNRNCYIRIPMKDIVDIN